MKLFLKVALFTVVMPGTRGPSPVVRQMGAAFHDSSTGT